jgi:hypothetical protein
MLTFSEEGTRGNDGESNPQPIYHTAQQGDDFMAEKWREGDDNEDGNGDKPARWEVANFF